MELAVQLELVVEDLPAHRVDALVARVDRCELTDEDRSAGAPRVLGTLKKLLPRVGLVDIDPVGESRIVATAPESRGDVVMQ